ncbi:MAG: hypothetical protein ACP5RD_07790 [bacterium]
MNSLYSEMLMLIGIIKILEELEIEDTNINLGILLQDNTLIKIVFNRDLLNLDNSNILDNDTLIKKEILNKNISNIALITNNLEICDLINKMISDANFQYFKPKLFIEVFKNNEFVKIIGLDRVIFNKKNDEKEVIYPLEAFKMIKDFRNFLDELGYTDEIIFELLDENGIMMKIDEKIMKYMELFFNIDFKKIIEKYELNQKDDTSNEENQNNSDN